MLSGSTCSDLVLIGGHRTTTAPRSQRHECVVGVFQLADLSNDGATRTLRPLRVQRLGKVKVKCTLVQALRLCTGRTAHRGSRGIALHFHEHGTRRGEGSASRPGRSLPPKKTRYPLYRRLGGPQGRSGQVRKISPPPGFDSRTFQPVASRYTDYATRPTKDSEAYDKNSTATLCACWNSVLTGEKQYAFSYSKTN